MWQYGNRPSHVGEDTDGVSGRVILLNIVITVDNYTLHPDTMLTLQKETKLLPQQTIKRNKLTMCKR